MKHIPNVITTIRTIGSLILLFTTPLSITFFVIYVICGVSDGLDGYVARRTKTNSQFGAKLDSISDMVFIGIIMVILLPLFQWSWWMLVWIGGIALTRVLSLIIGFVKYRTMTSLHTFANKVTGLVLFCFPLLYSIFGMVVTICLVSSLAIVSAIEELVINIISEKLDRDIRSIFKLIGC